MTKSMTPLLLILLYRTSSFVVSESIDPIIEETSGSETNDFEFNPKLNTEQFSNICAGQTFMSSEEQGQLSCFYSFKGEPYLIIQPIKIEIHHLKPLVLQLHDVITEKSARELKLLATPNLKDAAVLQLNGETSQQEGVVDTDYRITKHAFLNKAENSENKELNKLYRWIEIITGLSADVTKSHTEEIQVARYEIGGFYIPHYDYIFTHLTPEEKTYIFPEEIENGDRIATLMFYLSNVTKGGLTAFAKLGIGIKPKIYSAIFWYNLQLNGEPDRRTLHGGCPVLEGEKWVANVWFRYNGQFIKRPCSLNENE